MDGRPSTRHESTIFVDIALAFPIHILVSFEPFGLVYCIPRELGALPDPFDVTGKLGDGRAIHPVADSLDRRAEYPRMANQFTRKPSGAGPWSADAEVNRLIVRGLPSADP